MVFWIVLYFLNQVAFTGVSINVGQAELNFEYDQFEANIYPNPTKKSVNIVADSTKNVKFEVFISNQFGKQEFRQRYTHLGGKELYKMDITNLNSGIHFVKVLTSSGTTKLLKLEVVN